ncbi:MAG: SDR family NAD(P)-dependent oxidoreductase [Chloroflexota bacterium]
MNRKNGSVPARVALICGAGRHPGRSIALALAAAGWQIAAHDLQPLHLEELKQEIEQAGSACRTYVGDTGKGLAARALIDDVLNDWGQLDVLVYCLQAAPLADLLMLDEWDWQRALEINLSAPFLLAQAVVAVMREQKGGGGVFFVTQPQLAQSSLPLAAAQAGINGLVEAIASGLLAYNIHSAVFPADADQIETIVQEVLRRMSIA